MVTLLLGHPKRMSHIVCFDIDFFYEEKKKNLCKMVFSSKSWKIRCDDGGLMRWPIFQICHFKNHCQSRECFAPICQSNHFCLCIGKSQGFFWVLSDGIRKKIWLWQNWRRIIIHLHKWCMHRSIDLELFRAPSIENLYDSTVNSVTLPFTYIGKLSM